MGRHRKSNVRRDRNGKSRGEPAQIHPETLAKREIELERDGIVLEFKRTDGQRIVNKRTAEDAKAGFTLGRLLLRRQQGDEASSISQEQYDAGVAWAALVRRYALVMGFSLGPHAASYEISTGVSLNEPAEDTVLYVRRRFQDCFRALLDVSKIHGSEVREITYGVCIENWELYRVKYLYGQLRIGLNALGRALDMDRKYHY